MPINLDAINEKVNNFNQKYKTNFVFADYLRLANKNGQDSAFWQTFEEVYNSTIARKMKGEKFPNVYTMLSEFENEIIQEYRVQCQQNNANEIPAPFGNKNRQERATALQKIVEKQPLYKYLTVANAYKNGEIRIRDMRAITKELCETQGNVDREIIKNAIRNAYALKRVNETRSGIWKFFHPFRNNAEQRDSKNMLQAINDRFGVGVEAMYRVVTKEKFAFIKEDLDLVNYELNRAITDDDRAFLEEEEILGEPKDLFDAIKVDFNQEQMDSSFLEDEDKEFINLSFNEQEVGENNVNEIQPGNVVKEPIEVNVNEEDVQLSQQVSLSSGNQVKDIQKK